jgi:hypothetical protein
MGEPIPIVAHLPRGATVGEAVHMLHEVTLLSGENALPIGILRALVPAPRRPRVSFNFFNTPPGARPAPELGWHLEFRRPFACLPELPGEAELVLYARESADGGLALNFLHNAIELDARSIAQLTGRYRDALELLADAPAMRMAIGERRA